LVADQSTPRSANQQLKSASSPNHYHRSGSVEGKSGGFYEACLDPNEMDEEVVLSGIDFYVRQTNKQIDGVASCIFCGCQRDGRYLAISCRCGRDGR
jgi:hypothetical protein